MELILQNEKPPENLSQQAVAALPTIIPTAHSSSQIIHPSTTTLAHTSVPPGPPSLHTVSVATQVGLPNLDGLQTPHPLLATAVT